MSELEYGLKLPNGNTFWGQWGNNVINTPASRSVFREALGQTALELGWDVEEFVTRYKWVTRTVEVHADHLSIHDIDAAPPLEQLQAEANKHHAIPDTLPAAEPIRATEDPYDREPQCDEPPFDDEPW
jgi:hypothetical protein